MKKIILHFLKISGLETIVIRLLLILDNKIYDWVSRLSIMNNGAIHPKHHIIRYENWFKENIHQGDVVVDIGSNEGVLSLALATVAKKVYGIEIDKKLHLGAKNKIQKSNIEWIHADATTFDYTKIEKIDVITLSNVLEHIEHRSDFLKKILNQTVWKNPENKRVLIRVPMLDRDWLAVYKKEMGVEWRLDRTHFTEYTLTSFQEELRTVGLSIEKHHICFGELYADCLLRVK